MRGSVQFIATNETGVNELVQQNIIFSAIFTRPDDAVTGPRG